MAPPRLRPPPLAAPAAAHALFAANTDVGKTVVATALARAAARSAARLPALYLKPVQTGFPSDSDARHVSSFCPRILARVLFTYARPVSPHLAASPGRPVSDAALRAAVADALAEFADSAAAAPRAFALLETAGGVLSPVMSGSLQADLYRPFRLPSILVADAKLGGISSSLASYEALRIRGYDVPCIIAFDNPDLDNHLVIQRNVDSPSRVFTLPPPPPRSTDPLADHTAMLVYYDHIDKLSAPIFSYLIESHLSRIARLNNLPTVGKSKLWWPFTQHKLADPSPTVIDSAHGDNLTVYNPATQQLRNLYDACGSWWTLALGHGNVSLAKAAANAAGRYGHVIYPEAVHEPAVRLAERLINSAGCGWASRVFYSDDGSTAVEVALKMAFKKTAKSLNLVKPKLGVIGLQGGYHGDTIGAMDASNPSVFNKQVDWYTGRGMWFAPPTIALKNGKYRICLPDDLVQNQNTAPIPETEFASRDAIFDIHRDQSALAQLYRKHIETHLDNAEKELGIVYGALIIEPILMGAGGMLWVDPLFQRELVKCVRNRNPSAPVPVIYDEVFVGMYRLGFASAGTSLLHVRPDIACYAKCLTTIVPLAVTLASENVFEAFLGDTKAEALLHGHSFSAHPVGCEVALKSFDLIEQLVSKNERPLETDAASLNLASVWDSDLIERVSSLPNVSGVVVLGTVLAIELTSDGAQGYASLAAASVAKTLRSAENGIYARPLGNVLYLLASQETTSECTGQVLAVVADQLASSAHVEQQQHIKPVAVSVAAGERLP